MQYDTSIDDKIYDLFKNNNKLHFNKMLDEVFPKKFNPKTKQYVRHKQEILRQHIEKMIEQGIIERDKMIDENGNPIIGKPRYYWLSKDTKFGIHYGTFEGVRSEREGKDKKRTRFEDLSKTEQRKIAYQLLLSNISQDSSIDKPETTNLITGEILSYSSITLEGFRISELTDRKSEISSIEEIRKSFSKPGSMMEKSIFPQYFFTVYYNQLMHPQNWFLDLQLSRQEIEKCIELLEDKEHPLIRTEKEFNKEKLYEIYNEDEKPNEVIESSRFVNDDKKDKGINNSTFILACLEVFRYVFLRMCLFWMFKKSKKQVHWFKHLYGNKMTTNFFLNLTEQRREYENRIKEKLEGRINKISLDRNKIIEKKIKEILDHDIKNYDKLIMDELNVIFKKYGHKVKQPNKLFYNLLLDIIYPSFIRKEYQEKYRFSIQNN